MNTSLSKTLSVPDNESIVLLGTHTGTFKGYGLSKSESLYINTQVKKEPENKPKLLSINKLNKWIFVQIVPKKKEPYLTKENYRIAGNDLLSSLNKNKIDKITLIDIDDKPEYVLAFAEGMALGNYEFRKYKTNSKENTNALKTIKINSKNAAKKDIERLQIIIDAVYYTRTLINEPVSFLTAKQLSNEIRKLGKSAGFKVEVMNKAKIESLKMGGIIAVNKGSPDPPTFTIMEWKPNKAKNKKPFVFVGKGIVFDTGGLSLKPTPNSMDHMKSDMSGAGAVAGLMYAVAKAKLPVHIICLVPATDNRPAGNAYAPGDIVTMHNGLNVEVLNTDAEGRLILADALSYAKKYKPKLVFDIATLTGAAKAAIGHFGIVTMGTAEEKIIRVLIKSGMNVYERIAEFPFWEEYDKLIESDIADIKNIGETVAGAITAGKFLEHFTDYPWIHLDIAGPAFLNNKDSYRGKGGTGVGVRLLFDYLCNYS